LIASRSGWRVRRRGIKGAGDSGQHEGEAADSKKESLIASMSGRTVRRRGITESRRV
jgi:hypothetical protein